MKTNTTVSRFIAVSAAALGLALAVPLSASAAPRDPGARAESCERGRPAMAMQHRHGMFDLRGVDLSADQVAQLSKLRDEEKKAMREQGQSLRDQHDSLHQLVLSDSYTPAAAAEIIARIGAAQTEMMKLHAEQSHKLYQLLTPEQRTKVQQNELTGARRSGHGRY